MFAPQKGASPEQVVMLDNQLCLWSALLKQHTGKDVTRLKHGGAAGGITALARLTKRTTCFALNIA